VERPLRAAALHGRRRPCDRGRTPLAASDRRFGRLLAARDRRFGRMLAARDRRFGRLLAARIASAGASRGA
jgi:hypothetical protein